MKKKRILLNSFLAFGVLLSMLFQYVHTFEHISHQLSRKNCEHKGTSKHEITHEHQEADSCFACHFSLGSFVAPDIQLIVIQKKTIHSEYLFFYELENTDYFKGSLFALRGPPII